MRGLGRNAHGAGELVDRQPTLEPLQQEVPDREPAVGRHPPHRTKMLGDDQIGQSRVAVDHQGREQIGAGHHHSRIGRESFAQQLGASTGQRRGFGDAGQCDRRADDDLNGLLRLGRREEIGKLVEAPTGRHECLGAIGAAERLRVIEQPVVNVARRGHDEDIVRGEIESGTLGEPLQHRLIGGPPECLAELVQALVVRHRHDDLGAFPADPGVPLQMLQEDNHMLTQHIHGVVRQRGTDGEGEPVLGGLVGSSERSGEIVGIETLLGQMVADLPQQWGHSRGRRLGGAIAGDESFDRLRDDAEQ